MKRLFSYSIAGILLIGAVICTYFKFVCLGKSIPSDGLYWAQFGNYFGGVAGPLLSFLSIILLVHTINQQSRQIASSEYEARKRDILAQITKADEEIDRWLHRQLITVRPGDSNVEFGDIVWGLMKFEYASSDAFQSAVIRLHELTCLYCDALVLYKNNIDPYFIFTYHRKKAESLLAFLIKHQNYLGSMAGPSLGLCQANLNAAPRKA